MESVHNMRETRRKREETARREAMAAYYMKMGPPPTCHHVSVIKRNPFYKGPDNAKAELTAVTQKTRVFGGVKTRSLRFHMTIGDGHFGYTQIR